jgi:hypothetical protein
MQIHVSSSVDRNEKARILVCERAEHAHTPKFGVPSLVIASTDDRLGATSANAFVGGQAGATGLKNIIETQPVKV